jgi:hypothetical protein
MDAVLMALDAMEPEEEMPKPPVKDKKAKDRKAMDKKARDEAREELKEKLKDKLSAEDYAAACDDIDGMEAGDEGETEEEKEKREKKEADDKKAKDAEMEEKTKGAMDSAIKTVRETERGIRLALVDVRPWVGELSPSLALDSKDDVYRHTAVTLGVQNAKTLHADALWPIIQAQPKPGAQRPDGHNPMGLDAAATDKAAKYAPGISRIKAA